MTKIHLKTKNNIPKVFYDGSCGFCHRFVQFSLNHMRLEAPFIFSPIHGKLFHQTISGQYKDVLPDSIFVFDPLEGRVFDKGKAVIFILNRLGGEWKLLGCLLRIVPLFLLNFGYVLFAKIRHKFFKKPSSTCPVLSEELKQFFSD